MIASFDFPTFLEKASAEGGYPTDDVLRIVLPLFEQVQAAHESGQVAPLEGVAQLQADESATLFFPADQALPPRAQLFGLGLSGAGDPARGVDVVDERRLIVDFSEDQVRMEGGELSEAEAIVKQPRFLPGYLTWEHQAGQHDPLTDIFSLGLILASVATGLDLTNADDLEIFVHNRKYLFAVNSRLNPVVASAIVQMTELHRHHRAQDLPSLIRRLKNYREQPTEYDFDFLRIEGFKETSLTGKRRMIQSHLRDRLFEISRRNRLLYFKQTQHQVNLTLASVPAMLDYRNIKHEQLFVWHEQLAELLAKQSVVPLNRFVRFEDAPYVPELLEKIISEAKRDRAEYGFAQLKLVICFLRWNNLKEAPQERIVSPLLLLPVELTKKKGIRDSFALQATTHLAEVNPVLRHHLRQLYNLDLPEAIDLNETTLDKFHEFLAAQINASEQAVSLRKMDRPQIELIHQKARQRLDQYRRRQKLSNRTATGYSKLQHSYRREHLNPLGLQMFLQKVKTPPSPFAGVIGEVKSRPPMPEFVTGDAGAAAKPAGSVLEKEEVRYSLKGPEDQNPYHWIFDLCNITLGNFNYRKMSLVADYNQLVDSDLPNPAFDRIFSLQPKTLPKEHAAALPMSDLFTVVACDPTQAGAIAQARQGESFIIQGPPGTGKSQTITNLIADYIAQGKRVLFVCEKRAAIDVVYHRLGQQGLNELCCLIHDSQTDKKSFIQDVSRTYDKFLNHPALLEEIERNRTATVREMETHLNTLARFEGAMRATPESAGVPVRELLRRLVELRGDLPELSDLQEELLPRYRDWREFGHLLTKLAAGLTELGENPRWSTHVLRWLNPGILLEDRPQERIRQGLVALAPLVERMQALAASLPGLRDYLTTPLQVEELLAFCQRIRSLADRNLFELLNPRSTLSAELESSVRDLKLKQTEWEKAVEGAKAWRTKLGPDDCALALEQALALEKSNVPWLGGGYWKLRGVLRSHYDFTHHAIARSWVLALRELDKEHQAHAAMEAARHGLELRFGCTDVTEFQAYLQETRDASQASPPALKKILTRLRDSASGASEVVELLQIAEEFSLLSRELTTLLIDYAELPWPELRRILDDLQAELPLLRELAGALGELKEAPAQLTSAFRQLPVTVDQLEAASGRKSLHGVYREDRYLSRFDGRLWREKMDQLQEGYRRLLVQNGQLVAARQQQRFLEHVNLSTLPVSQLSGGQKLFKKTYATGRRELEHEFSKTMRYRAIRELAAGATGRILADLKPVWLMSPLSVSDTLPLETGYFDVVIFDEASQIPVEDAVPALYRANQVIVVGDEMQLPPTKFFASSQSSDDETLVVEEDEEKIEINLEADSFLTQSAINLPSTMLGWHYRSRSEALIGYSNAAFYRGELLTIPDRALPRAEQKEILVQAGETGEDHLDHLLERSLSFHFHTTGVYEDRRNRAEADYIAQLVRGLLIRRTGKSLGIVAFSEAQQTEIENALQRLGQTDGEFRELYESELEREEEGQFCGLFIKNLENVQGDERDIILLSVCYGYDHNRRMLMNFGPINQRGGEKRLNVIFSRAKEHMAIVSSIRYSDVKNEYNDGANNLRLFLQYAEAFSRGDWETARRILANLNPQAKKALSRPRDLDVVADQLAAGLRGRGWAVDFGVGQSRFRCDLAVRDPDASNYALGIFVDSEERAGGAQLLERAVFQPRVLHSFGWRFAHVLTKDWFHDPQGVLDRLERCWKEPEPEVIAEPAPEPVVETVEIKPSPLVEEEVLPEEPATPEPLPVEQPASVPTLEDGGDLVDQQIYHFELDDAKSHKFWEIVRNGNEFTTRYGKVGSAGQSQTKTWPNEAMCQKEARKVIREKVKKGYRSFL